MQTNMYTRERKRTHRINIVKGPYLDSPLAAAQSLLLEGLEDFRGLRRLNNNDQQQAIQIINKTLYQTVPKY
jgi:hypothetical protein